MAKKSSFGLDDLIGLPAKLLMAVIGIVLFMVIGGLSLPYIISLFTNIWLWIAAIALALISKDDNKSVLIWAVIVGVAMFGYGIYMTLQNPICQVPIIGGILCGAWNIVTFIPQLIGLGVNIMVVYLMITLAKFVKEQIS